MANNEKLAKLKAIADKLAKKHQGKIGYVGSEISKIKTVEWVKTKFPNVNYLLGGGIPLGKIIEIFGEPSSGKSTFTLKLIAELQERGRVATFLDLERSFDPVWAEVIGVNTEELAVMYPLTAEETLNLIKEIVLNKASDLVVVDSLASLTTMEDFTKDLEKDNLSIPPLARKLSFWLRQIIPFLDENKVSIIFINQTRDKIQMSGYGFHGGMDKDTVGGNAVKFYSSIRIHIAESKKIKNENNEEIGKRVVLKNVKNKLGGKLGKKIELPFYYDEGFSLEESIIEDAIKLGVIHQSGAFYSFKDPVRKEEVKVRGKRELVNLLKQNKDLLKYLTDKVSVLYQEDLIHTKFQKKTQNKEN